LLGIDADGKLLSQKGRPMEPTQAAKKRVLLAIFAGVAFYVLFAGMAVLAIRDTVQSESPSEADSISRIVGIVALVLAVLAWRKASRAGRRPWAWALGTFVSAGAAYISLWVLTPQREPEKPDRLPGEDYEQYLRRVTRPTESDASPAQVGAGNMEPEAEPPPPPEPDHSRQLAEVATTPAPVSPAVERRSPRPRKAAPYAIGAAVALASVGAVWVAYSLGTRQSDDSTIAAVSSRPASMTPTPSPSPTPTPEKDSPPAEVVERFHDKWSKGERLWFAGIWFPNHDRECRMHTFTYRGRTHGAFQSDCASWEGNGYDILIFDVALRNATAKPVRFNLRHFVLVTRDDRSFGPVNVRAQATFPPNFLPERTLIAPHTMLQGYVTFDGRVVGVVPGSMNYIDGQQTLTQTFQGHHAVTFP
jgi:hypothetical protein